MSQSTVYEQITNYLGSAGILFPTTMSQAKAFERLINQEKKEEFAYPAADTILQSAYHTLKEEGKIIQLTTTTPATEDFAKAAARNGKDIPKEILERMRKDRDEHERNQ